MLPTLIGGNGTITTTTTNINGILGGWAMVGDDSWHNGNLPMLGTNWACVDAVGNIVNYSNYTVYTSGLLKDIMWVTNNIMIDDSSSGYVTLDVDHADPALGVTHDVNTISVNRAANWALKIGTNNVLRLGKTGAIFEQLKAAGPTWGISSLPVINTRSAAQGAQNNGTLTAGGPTDNTAGELIIIINQSSSGSANNVIIDSQIADNGSGPVTVVKTGPGVIKFGGHNTYSGGTYLLQGRIQTAGNEVGTPNPDVVGSGDLYLFPGSYLYLPSASGYTPFTNRIFMAGSGIQQEKLGAIRFSAAGWDIATNVILIGDATLGGNNGWVSGPISGPFNLTCGSAATVSGSLVLSNATPTVGPATRSSRPGKPAPATTH